MYRQLFECENIAVRQGHGQRHLLLNGHLMGRMSVNTGEPISDYMKEIIRLWPPVKNANLLVIGGGAFLLPTYYQKRGVNVYVVEPSEPITDVAIQYFGMDPRKIKRISRSLKQWHLCFPWDAIVLDAYDTQEPVKELYNEDMLKKLERASRVLLVNDTRIPGQVYKI